MATKDDKPGLLSKVAMFVRNPTKDWSELDPAGDIDASGYDKQALKAMIERKRQNDFVRKREFDQLRKLRNRDPAAMGSLGQPSYFQHSLPGEPGEQAGRADTLKKIDAIEANMSRQWWENQAGAAGPTLPPSQETQPPQGDERAQRSATQPDLLAPYERTQPASVAFADGSGFAEEFVVTQRTSDMGTLPGPAPAFTLSAPFGAPGHALENDPDLEEAAIRFANHDNAGAEKSLLAALRGSSMDHPLAPAWAAALLDLYRATHNPGAFDSACQAFPLQLGGARPDWFALGTAPQPGAMPAARTWDCPVVLDAQGMEQLRLALAASPMPWYLGWDALEQIAPDALDPLNAIFNSLCLESVALRLQGQASLLRVLRALTVEGDVAREVPPWQLHLHVLRVLGLQDDFKRLARAYSATYGVQPPVWAPARCTLAGPDPARLLVLQGEITGDSTLALAVLEATPAEGHPILVSCRDLVRVDFSAAGSILNWAMAHQLAGAPVQFLEMHRLVAAFFYVIGIHECAQVGVRSL